MFTSNKKSIKTTYDLRVDKDVDIIAENNPRFKFCHEFTNKHVKDASRILDVGCGVGSYIFPKDGDGCVGIELETDALKMAKKYCIKSNFFIASALNLPFRDRIFDLVSMWEVIEHLPVDTEIQAISEIKRVLKDGGYLLLSTPNRHIIANIMDPAYFLRGHRHYNVTALVDLITKLGLSVKNYTIQGGLNSLIAINLFYVYKHILHKREGPFQKFFDEKSEKEYSLEKNGFANIFVAAQKVI